MNNYLLPPICKQAAILTDISGSAFFFFYLFPSYFFLTADPVFWGRMQISRSSYARHAIFWIHHIVYLCDGRYLLQLTFSFSHF